MKGLDARSLVAHFARHPGDLPVVTRAAWRLRQRSWWRRAPFLPVPGREYWRFRLATATGSSSGSTSAREVVEYAKWSDLQRTGR